MGSLFYWVIWFNQSAISGGVSLTLAYPIEIIRRNLQIAGSMQNLATNNGQSIMPLKSKSMIKYLYSKYGWKGFFRGLSIGYMKVIPMHSISFGVYEIMMNTLPLHF